MKELHYKIDESEFILISYKKTELGIEYIIIEVERNLIFSKFEIKGKINLIYMLRDKFPEYFI